MARFAFNIADNKLPRVLAAYSFANPLTGEVTPGTVEMVEADCKAYVLSRIENFERENDEKTRREQRAQETW